MAAVINKVNLPALFLGIDTGGTFTDGVLLDPISRRVVKTAKVLTSHADLSLCIARVLDELVADQPADISLVSLSTTLATNAIAEGKRRPVGLFLLGYDAGLVHQYFFQNQFGTSHYYFVQGKHGLDGSELIPLDEADLIRAASEAKGKVDAFAVVSYAGSRNAEHEERAAEMLASLVNTPIIQAHHLSNELDSIRRATTASLNASLLSSAQDLLLAVQEMLSRRHIHCPVMMVKGDGSIANVEYARSRPVEFIHSGPATSAIGGQFLSGAGSALVIDMGGTTTDIALVEDGKIQVEPKAATVAHYRTCVRTVKTRSIGLGGDSRIHFDRSKKISIGPEHLLPLSHLCADYPAVKRELLQWLEGKNEISYPDRIEYWVLRREPLRPLTDPRTQKAIALLKTAPQHLPKLLKQVGAVSPVQLNVEELVNQEIVDRAGLTPTDILHATGEFAPWDNEIALRVIEVLSRGWGITPEAFIQQVKDRITYRIVEEVIQFLSGKQLSDSLEYTTRGNHLDRWLFEESLVPENRHLRSAISLKDPIVGIGAPANAFLPAVAQALGTQITLPEHYAVANAVGTVVGNVMVRKDGEIFPLVEGTVVTGYLARTDGRQQRFDGFDEALAFARAYLIDMAGEEARRAGARDPLVECAEKVVLPGMVVHLSAWGVGKPGLDGLSVERD
jgi:N-methylhydantoinase A/oxoprolinase/acetone carboxylase beta subunit